MREDFAEIIREIVHDELQKALGLKLAYTFKEAAHATGFSVETLRQAVLRSDLVPSYVNTKPVFTADELKRWLNSLPAEPRRVRRRYRPEGT